MPRIRRPHLGLKFIPNIVFVSSLAILYIANTYFAERKANQISKLQEEIEYLSIEHNTLKYRYTQKTSYDSLKNLVTELGLIENDSQVILIEID